MLRTTNIIALTAVVLSVASQYVVGFSSELSRRQAFAKVTTSVVGGVGTLISVPELSLASVTDETPRVTTRMGGLMEPYQDPRGFRIMAPSGWNKFDGEVGAYDVKWQDLVDPTENIKISSSPVKSTTTSIDALGELQDVAKSLAVKRNANLIKAVERITDGVLFYTFEFAIKDGTHQLFQICVAKGRIWSLDANSKEKRWGKREEMYYNIVGSFTPKLN